MTVDTLLFQTNSLATYCTVASYCVLLYDFLLTLESEIELIWPTRWNVGKGLFVATRYLPLVDGAVLLYYHVAPSSTSLSLCTALFQTSGVLIIWGMLVAELVLVFRTWAVWGRSNKILRGFFVILSITSVPTGYVSYKAYAHLKFIPSPYPHLQTCWLPNNPHSLIYIAYIVVVFFESVMLGLTLFKGWNALRAGASSLVSTLFRDGIMYYIYLVIVSLINIFIILKMPPPQPSLIFMQRVLHSIFTARILLNLRKAANQDRACLSTEITRSRVPYRGAADGRRPGNTALSSVILGVETWFRDTRTQPIEYAMDNTTDTETTI